ncbi:N-acetyltransferase [Pelagibius litoralis]|uniref:N-acetyltransferase n=1 Tax=Pelagibius litoralis TaxID=374515 RepID=A0A967EWX6_9PROT|nr:N-acetyltransferase [Pelagibius litoralis]NIA68853.1 N-acetyltransferase [Pelagibius litoralis]
MIIRETLESDLPALLDINRLAFGEDDEAALVQDILGDPSAEPTLSLIAFDGERPVGHILFSRARLSEPDSSKSLAILAPLAVVPDAQRQGIGGRLIESGLAQLTKSGVDLVFVLGDPDYYQRHGFRPAGRQGLNAPYPVSDEHADAWMVQGLREGAIDTAGGRVVCCDVLDRPELWRE